MKILVVAPVIDVVTTTSAAMALNFASWAKNLGHDVTVLFGVEATLLPFYVANIRQDFIYYAGHGAEDALIGDEILLGLITPLNAEWLSKRVTVTMACDTNRILGPKVINVGGFIYVGATDVLYGAFPEIDHDYLADWMDYMLLLPEGIVNGMSIGDALNALKSKALAYADSYDKSGGYVNGDWYASTARHNASVYQVLGNADLKMSEIKEEDKTMGLFEGLQFLFKPETLSSQWDDARKALTTFGVVGAIVGGVIADVAVEGISRATGYKVPSPARELAKAIGATAGGAGIPV